MSVQSSIDQTSNETWTIKRVLDWCVGYLSRKGEVKPRLTTERLIAQATGLTRVELYTNFDRPLEASELDAIRESIRRKGNGEPLQYVLGEAPFRYMTILVEPGVLIPRPETELLVEAVLEAIDEAIATRGCATVVEVGTGSGCIALSLAAERPGKVRVIATDISPSAISLASKNRDALNLHDTVTFIECDLLEGLSPDLIGKVDVVVSNPPYIPSDELEHLPREVADYEPMLALDGGEDGLMVFRKIACDAQRYLRPGALIAFELHENRLCQAAAECVQWYQRVEIRKDLVGRDRLLLGRAIA